MSPARDISLMVWLIVFYLFAQYASANLNMPTLEMNYIVWAQDEQFFLTTKDVFMIVGAIFLATEMYKGATIGMPSIVGSVVSFVAIISFIVMFLTWDKVHTTEFLLLIIMALLDVIGKLVTLSKK